MHSTHCWWLYLTIHFQPQFSRIHDLALGTYVIKNLFFDFCLPNNELQFASTYYFLNLVFYRNDYCNSTVFTDVHTMVNLQEKNDFLTQCTVKKVICLWNKLQRERERDCKKLPNKVLWNECSKQTETVQGFCKGSMESERERPPQPEGNYFDRNHLHSTLNHSLACWLVSESKISELGCIRCVLYDKFFLNSMQRTAKESFTEKLQNRILNE